MGLPCQIDTPPEMKGAYERWLKRWTARMKRREAKLALAKGEEPENLEGKYRDWTM